MMQAILRDPAKKYFLQEGNDESVDDGNHSSRWKDDLHQQLLMMAFYAVTPHLVKGGCLCTKPSRFREILIMPIELSRLWLCPP